MWIEAQQEERDLERREENRTGASRTAKGRKVAVLCKKCGKRLCDRIENGTGSIEIKCIDCGHINRITLSFRRGLLYRRTGLYAGTEYR